MDSEPNRDPDPHDKIAPIQRWLLLAVSFWGGLQIMVLEVCGFRVLQTNLGSSVIVTGTLLTLIMVLLSSRYYLGGLLSHRLGNPLRLFVLLTLAAVYTGGVTAVFMDPILSLGVSVREALDAHPYLRG